MTWRDTYEIIWHGPTTEDLERVVRDEIASELSKYAAPSDLVFLPIFLAEDDAYSGPCVMIWGEEGDSRLHAQYHPAMSPVTLDEVVFE